MKEVLDKIIPSKEEKERVRSLANDVVSEIKKLGYSAEVMGSVAKDTWISGEADIDVFIFFSQKTDKSELERKGLEIGKKIFKKLGGKFEIGFAEHPYVKGEIKGIKVDIVPAYKLKKVEIKSSVDRTPFHTHYVNKKLKKKQRNDVLLLKQFCKGQDVYGSELKIEGLSGYLCELLIIRYENFKETIDAISKWQEGKIIDIGKYYLKEEEKKVTEQFDAPLICIDPVDMNRNVAAVLNKKNFLKLVKAAKSYKKKSAIRFFFPEKIQEMDPSKVKDCLFVVFPKEKILDDILYPQMRATVNKLETALDINGFEVLKSGVWANGESVLVIRLKKVKIPESYKHIGPPLSMEDHVKKFRKKYKQVKTEKGKLFVTKKRKYPDSVGFTKAYLKGGKGIASHLDFKKAKVISDSSQLFKEDFGQWFTRWYNEKN